MQQLFYNLLNNALKFTRPDVRPGITISCRQALGEELEQSQLNRYKSYYEIAVKDNGAGFDQQHADKIFTIFNACTTKRNTKASAPGFRWLRKWYTTTREQ